MRLILTLILIFSFQSWTKADDIRDFQIEGMSIGDSALDFATKSEIVSLKNSYKDKGYIYNSKKFYSITFRNHPNLNTYENIQFILKDNDKKYKIYGILGVIEYIEIIYSIIYLLVNSESSLAWAMLGADIFII